MPYIGKPGPGLMNTHLPPRFLRKPDSKRRRADTKDGFEKIGSQDGGSTTSDLSTPMEDLTRQSLISNLDGNAALSDDSRRKTAKKDAPDEKQQPKKLHRPHTDLEAVVFARHRETEREIETNLTSLLKRRAERKAYDKELKKHTHRLWGFDPRAGLLPTPIDTSPANRKRLAIKTLKKPESDGCLVQPALHMEELPSVFYEPEDMNTSSRKRFQKKFIRGRKWGVESGGPGREGHWAHGRLKDKESLGLVANLCHPEESTAEWRAQQRSSEQISAEASREGAGWKRKGKEAVG